MNKKVKVSASQSKAISEKLKKYESLNSTCKNVLGGIGVGGFGRLGGMAMEKAKNA